MVGFGVVLGSVRDLLAAIVAALAEESRDAHGLDLGGPESLSYRALVERCAALHGNRVRIVNLPISLLMGFAGLMERVSKNPPITRAMLGVLEHADCIDNRPALEILDIGLTPLNETLARYIGPPNKAS